ncbi:MAG: hypothetical protein Ct9H300mP28_04730 [Pseudomonadota bacterium]|nr:MAG: hypothetical protein Ct9H300mP28_04730 [Pseudomonadota bacterium]
MKSYFYASLTQPILDMIRHPLEKFLIKINDSSVSGIKKGGLFMDMGLSARENIFVSDKVVRFISPQEYTENWLILGVANDVHL